MDRDQVLAFRESFRIQEFLDVLVGEREISELDRAIICQEDEQVFEHAGYVGTEHGVMGEEAAAVVRHSNHAMKQKLLALRPGLANRLSEFIARRPYHPIPHVPADARRPGTALAQYKQFASFLKRSVQKKAITQDKAYEVYQPAIRMFDDEGVDYTQLSSKTDPAVIVHALALMKATLLKLHPELAPELEALGRSRPR